MFAPPSVLPGRGVTWRAETDNVIVARFDLPPEHPEVRLRIDEHGAIRTVSALRWGNAGEKTFQYIPFGGEIHAERRFGDLVLPSSAQRRLVVRHPALRAVLPCRDQRSHALTLRRRRPLPSRRRTGGCSLSPSETWDRCRVTISGTGTPLSAAGGPEGAAVDLYWLPLGAGGHFVRLNGRVFEAVAARAARRPACDLYHSALEVRVAAARFVIEQAPVRDARGEQRGVVAEGPVGMRWAGRFRIFRYEIRRWRDGRIPTSTRPSKARGD